MAVTKPTGGRGSGNGGGRGGNKNPSQNQKERLNVGQRVFVNVGGPGYYFGCIVEATLINGVTNEYEYGIVFDVCVHARVQQKRESLAGQKLSVPDSTFFYFKSNEKKNVIRKAGHNGNSNAIVVCSLCQSITRLSCVYECPKSHIICLKHLMPWDAKKKAPQYKAAQQLETYLKDHFHCDYIQTRALLFHDKVDFKQNASKVYSEVSRIVSCNKCLTCDVCCHSATIQEIDQLLYPEKRHDTEKEVKLITDLRELGFDDTTVSKCRPVFSEFNFDINSIITFINNNQHKWNRDHDKKSERANSPSEASAADVIVINVERALLDMGYSQDVIDKYASKIQELKDDMVEIVTFLGTQSNDASIVISSDIHNSMSASAASASAGEYQEESKYQNEIDDDEMIFPTYTDNNNLEANVGNNIEYVDISNIDNSRIVSTEKKFNRILRLSVHHPITCQFNAVKVDLSKHPLEVMRNILDQLQYYDVPCGEILLFTQENNYFFPILFNTISPDCENGEDNDMGTRYLFHLQRDAAVFLRTLKDNVGVLRCTIDLPKLFQHNQSIKSKFTSLSKYYGGWRAIRGDGNCYYRAIYFSLLEQIVSSGKLEKLSYLLELIDLYYHDGSFRNILVTILQEARDGKRWKNVYELERDVLMISSHFDLGMVAFCRQLVAKFLLTHKHVAIAELTLEEMVTTSYNVTSMEEYCIEYVEKMGEDAEGMLVDLGILLHLLRCDGCVILLDRRDNVNLSVMRLSPLLSTVIPNPNVGSPMAEIDLLLRPGHYELLYRHPDVSLDNIVVKLPLDHVDIVE